MTSEPEAQFEDKFVAFVDVLGFKSMIEAAERGDGKTLAEIQEILDELGYLKDKDFIRSSGPKICPKSPYVAKNLSFEITQVSDCMIASAEVSPAGIINLVAHCHGAAATLLNQGVMVRGYITRGNIFHRGMRFMGTGYHEAYGREGNVEAFKIEADEKGTPFIEIDQRVTEYVENCDDWCTKEMYRRMVESDGQTSAIFPFKSLSHSFSIGGLNAAKELQANNNMRLLIENLKTSVMSHVAVGNQRAIVKTRHYVAALDRQLAICDRTDEIIRQFS